MSKKYYNIGPWAQCYKTFFCVIYAITWTFPNNFNFGYANSNVIMSKKFYNIESWA
jgi:hypothetical protein